MSLELLKWIVDSSKANANEKYPDGYTYLTPEHENAALELHSSGHIEANVRSRDDKGNFPVRPTAQGVAALTQSAQTTAHHPVAQAVALKPQPMQVEDNIPVPEKKAFGRVSGGDDKVSQFGFDKWQVNQSVFLPQPTDTDKPIHRTFSSVVSQANRKLFPKNFVIREWEGGARIWRIEDMTGPRPTRARTVKPAAQPVTQPGPAFPGGFAAPGHPQFGATEAPAPFNAPGPGFSGFAAPAGGPGPDWQSGSGFNTDLPDFEP